MGTYVTTYCNKPHDLLSGKPVGHECYILDPEALEAERGGDADLANEIGIVKQPRKTHRGVRPRRNPAHRGRTGSPGAVRAHLFAVLKYDKSEGGFYLDRFETRSSPTPRQNFDEIFCPVAGYERFEGRDFYDALDEMRETFKSWKATAFRHLPDFIEG